MAPRNHLLWGLSTLSEWARYVACEVEECVTQAILILVAVAVAVGAMLRLQSRWIRHRVVRTIPKEDVKLQALGCSMRVLVQGTQSLAGMSSRKANRTTGHLVLAEERFVLVTSRGVVADLRPTQGRKFSSVRSTGPGRLIIEGTVPTSRTQEGQYRVEMQMKNAQQWVEALQPWVDGDSDFTSF